MDSGRPGPRRRARRPDGSPGPRPGATARARCERRIVSGMTGGPAHAGTIPRLLTAAAQHDGDGTWLRTDAGSLTFAGARTRVATVARALTEAGIRRGDLVVVTARNRSEERRAGTEGRS